MKSCKPRKNNRSNKKSKEKIYQKFINRILDQEFNRIAFIAEALAYGNRRNIIINTFISVVYTNGITEYLELSDNEINILKTAKTHNNGFINLRGGIETIKSLINKGLIEIKFDEITKDYDLALSKIAEAVFKKDTEIGYPCPSRYRYVDEGIEAVSWCLVND